MSITHAEKLKVELTDKWVVVADEVPELRRFRALTGKVKTVNMNCRALVEFDGPEDISWYDIDPQFLTVVDGPRPRREEAPKPKAEKSKGATASTTQPAGNPLDMIRGSGAAKPASAAPKSGDSPLDKIRAGGSGATSKPSDAAGSPLDKIRSQAADTQPAPTDEEPAKPEAAPQKPESPAPTGSPLDQIRAGGAFKG